MGTDRNYQISDRDRRVLDAQAGNSWKPKNPRELLLPYIDQSASIEKSDLDKRLEKAKEVYDDYGKIINECKELRAVIDEKCKEVKVSVTSPNHHGIRLALQRVFGIEDPREITFQMYKQILEAWAEIGNRRVQEPLETRKG